MAATNYKETAKALGEQDGGISEFKYNPKFGRIEFETKEEREFYMSPGEIGGYNDTYLTEDDLGIEEVQEAMAGIEELYTEIETKEDFEKLTGEELEAEDNDGSVEVKDTGDFNYPTAAKAELN